MKSTGFVVLAVTALCACAETDGPHAPAEAVPASAAAVSGSVTLGTVGGRYREDVTVASVRVSQSPITVHDYRLCVEAGVCAGPARFDGACASVQGLDGSTWTDAKGPRELQPMTCTSASQAAKYCAWVGGRLPRVDEWLLAARGREVHRYPWGDKSPTCTEVQRIQFNPGSPILCCGHSCNGDGAMVGTHPSGRGAGVLDDVLLAHGEYVSGIATKKPIACAAGSTCVVRGTSPAAIEGFVSEAAGYNLEVAGFRCAWSEQ